MFEASGTNLSVRLLKISERRHGIWNLSMHQVDTFPRARCRACWMGPPLDDSVVLFVTDGEPMLAAETGSNRCEGYKTPPERRLFTFGVGADLNARPWSNVLL